MANTNKLSVNTQKLEQEYQRILQLIARYTQALKNGKKVIDLIEKYSTSYEKLDKKLLSKTNDFQISLSSITEVKSKIENLQSSAEQTLSQIQQPLLDLQTKTQELNLAYEGFNQTKERIVAKELEVQEILSSATQTRDNITNLNNSATQALDQINNALTSVRGKITELNQAYDTFLQVKKAIDNPDTGLQAILATSNSVQKEILAIKEQGETLFTEISRIKDDSNNFFKDIGNIKQKAQTDANKIKEYEKESSENKQRIEKIYRLATDSSLANSFDRRKKQLYIGVIVWFVASVLSVVALLLMLNSIHQEVFKNGNTIITNLFWYRLTLTFPLIFLIGFSAQQYSKERGLLEKYAFKSANAFALESYTTLLTSKFNNKFEEKILNFVIQSMSVIYKEPYENSRESKISVVIGNKLAEFKTEFTEKLEETKEEVEKTVEKLAARAPKRKTT